MWLLSVILLHCIISPLNFILHHHIVTPVRSVLIQVLVSNLIALFVVSDISDHIDVSPVYVLESSLVCIDPDAHRSVNPGNLDAVPRPHMVHQVLIRAQMDRLRRLALRHTFRRLLHLDVLLVGEETRVEVGLESVPLLAIHAKSGLDDSAHLHGTLFLPRALSADKVSLFHLRDNVTVANDNASERDQFLDMIRPQLPNPIHFAQIVWAHLNNLVITEFVVVHVEIGVLVIWAGAATPDIVHVELFEDLGDDEIENGNDVGRVVLDLPIKHLIELEHVVTVDLKNISVELAHFLQFLDVVWGFLILLIVIFIIVIFDLLKVVDEVLELHLDLGGVDIGAPEHHRMRAHFTAGAHTSL